LEYNSAREGGAVNLRADVRANFLNSTFYYNTATVEGGALKALNPLNSGDRRSRINITDCSFERNAVGSNPEEDLIHWTNSRGGVGIFTGSGIELLSERNHFENNNAGEGGVFFISAAAGCKIVDNE